MEYSYTVDYGQVNTACLKVAEGYVMQEPLKDYVILPNGNNAVYLLFGTVDAGNNVVTDGVCYDIRYSYADYTNNHGYTCTAYDFDAFSWSNPVNAVIYSTAAGHPIIHERGDVYEKATLFAVCVAFCFVLVSCIFKHVEY